MIESVTFDEYFTSVFLLHDISEGNITLFFLMDIIITDFADYSLKFNKRYRKLMSDKSLGSQFCL